MPITKSNPKTISRGPLVGRTFTTERGYRDALARRKGFPSFAAQQRKLKRVSGARDLDRLRPQEVEGRERSLHALSLMRTNDMSLSRAARAAETTPNTVRRYVGNALSLDESGRWEARSSDRLFRRMKFLEPSGLLVLDVRNSRTASTIGEYWAAVEHYLNTGDDRALRRFRGRSINVSKRTHHFVTDKLTLNRLAARGELSFEGLYE